MDKWFVFARKMFERIKADENENANKINIRAAAVYVFVESFWMEE